MQKSNKLGIFVVLVALSFLVFSMASCSQEPEPQDTDTTDVVEPDTVEVPEVVEPELTLDAEYYLPGAEILVNYKVPADFEDDAWVGLIPSEVEHGDEEVCDEFDLDFHLIGDEKEAEVIFYAPEECGMYDIRLFDSDFEGKEILSVSFEVVQEIPSGDEEIIEEVPVEEEPVDSMAPAEEEPTGEDTPMEEDTPAEETNGEDTE